MAMPFRPSFGHRPPAEPRLRLTLLAAVVVAITACGDGPPGTATLPPGTATLPPGTATLPVHRSMAESMLAEIEGLLLRDGDCIVIAQPEGRVLPIWPSDTRLVGDTVTRRTGVVAAVGGKVHFGGGFIPCEAVRATMDEDVPEDCRIGNYFLIGDTPSPAS